MNNEIVERKSNVGIIIAAVAVIFVAVGSFLFLKKDNSNTDSNDKPSEQNYGEYFKVSSTNLIINEGETATFDISLKNAVGRIDVRVDDNSVASVDEENIWLESIDNTTVDTKTITITGLGVGETKVIVDLNDVASFDSEEQLTGSITVNVTVK